MVICAIISLNDRFHACAYKMLKHILLVHINAASAIAAPAQVWLVRKADKRRITQSPPHL